LDFGSEQTVGRLAKCQGQRIEAFITGRAQQIAQRDSRNYRGLVNSRYPFAKPSCNNGTLCANCARRITIQLCQGNFPSLCVTKVGRTYILQNVLRSKLVQQFFINSIEHDWPDDRPCVRIGNKRNECNPDGKP
jgi:hypothetical protein